MKYSKKLISISGALAVIVVVLMVLSSMPMVVGDSGESDNDSGTRSRGDETVNIPCTIWDLIGSPNSPPCSYARVAQPWGSYFWLWRYPGSSYGGLKRGALEFDTSVIPTGAKIKDVTLTHNYYFGYYPSVQLNQMASQLQTCNGGVGSQAMTLFDDCVDGPTYAIMNFPFSSGSGWRSDDLGPQADIDFQTSLSTASKFAIGFNIFSWIGRYSYYYVYSNSYLTVKYSLGLDATIDIDPDTLNMKSEGKWVTCYMELEPGYDVSNIDTSTLILTYEGNDIPVEPHPQSIDDYDNDGITDLMIKFDRHELINVLATGDSITLEVSGNMQGGMPLEGSDTIRVIQPGHIH